MKNIKDYQMCADRFDLSDKVAVITGGSRGIGRAIALGFAEHGADVVVASRKLPDLEKVAQEIRERGARSLAIAAHVGKKEDIENLIAQTVKEFGRIDILVNNAATNPVFGPLIDLTEEAWDKTLELGLRGYFLCSKAAAKVMIEGGKGGNIINMATDGAFRAGPGMGAYCISKAGVVMLTKVLAVELAQYNIRVNAIAPGLVKTRFSTAIWSSAEIIDMLMRTLPMKRIAEPDEIVGAAIFLVSGASSYVTGTTISVDGGSMA
jgi:NAD(P)-dependent dehydrogenase (short-subunit alcohol dehydrogenase family)